MAGAIPIVGPLLGLVGQGVQGFVGVKQGQMEVINNAMQVLSDVNKSDDARAVAAAQIISAESRSESWLTRTWRPIVVLSFTGVLFGYFFGYVPSANVTPEIVNRIFDLVEYSVLGYMGMRSADKWVRELSLGSVLKKVVSKKLTNI